MCCTWPLSTGALFKPGELLVLMKCQLHSSLGCNTEWQIAQLQCRIFAPLSLLLISNFRVHLVFFPLLGGTILSFFTLNVNVCCKAPNWLRLKNWFSYYLAGWPVWSCSVSRAIWSNISSNDNLLRHHYVWSLTSIVAPTLLVTLFVVVSVTVHLLLHQAINRSYYSVLSKE